MTTIIGPGPAQLAPRFQQPQRVVPVPGFRGAVERALPFGRTGFQVQPGLPTSGPMQQNAAVGICGPQGTCAPSSNGRVNAAGQCAPPGWHWNKSGYTRLGGPCSSKPAGFVERGTELVRNRRKFNTANGPARNRAIARLMAGEKDAKAALKVLGFRTISKQSSREMRMRRRGHR